ncbi:MAG TPA: hypothetical protein VGF34_11165 [Stellaceae bacterium]|jgi:hypothetical protein
MDDERSAVSQETQQRPLPWFGFWLPLFVATALAVIGAFVAGRSHQPDDYACGFALFLGAVAFAFLWLKRRLDGGGARWEDFLLVSDMRNLAFVIPMFTVIGIFGLFLGAAHEGSLHVAGVALFVVSGIFVFFEIKHVFDCREGGRR